MLTESVNKVYLLSYNACETQILYPVLTGQIYIFMEEPALHNFTVSL